MPDANSDALVLFGATGDLAQQQIYPALYALTKHGRLNIPIICTGRQPWSASDLRARVRESVAALESGASGAESDQPVRDDTRLTARMAVAVFDAMVASRLLDLAARFGTARTAQDCVRTVVEEFGEREREDNACVLVAQVTA